MRDLSWLILRGQLFWKQCPKCKNPTVILLGPDELKCPVCGTIFRYNRKTKEWEQVG